MKRIEFDPVKAQEAHKEKPYLAGLYDIRKKYPQVDGLLEELENFDQTTFRHSLRAEAYAWNLATELGFKEEDRRIFCLAAVLHDTGKEVLDKSILNDPNFNPKRDLHKMEPHVIASFKKVYNICPEAAEIILRHHCFQTFFYPSDEKISQISKVSDPVMLAKIEKMANYLALIDNFEVHSGVRSKKGPEPLKSFLPDIRKQFNSKDDGTAINILSRTLGKEKIIKRLHKNIKADPLLYLKMDIKGVAGISGDMEEGEKVWRHFGYDVDLVERRKELLSSLSGEEKERLERSEQEIHELVGDLQKLPEVKRLHFLMQLGGTAERAQQTRHSHSELNAEIAKFAGVKLQLPIEDIKISMASAWLHDIGHAALCHVSDPVLEKHGFGNHEERTVRAIADKTGAIYKILQKYGVDPSKVIETIREKGYLGSIQSFSDTLSYLIIDSMAVRKPIFEDQGAELISNLRGIDKERGLLIVESPELWRQVLEKRAEMMRDVYLHPLNRRNRAATRVLIEMAAKYKCIPLEQIVKGTDMNIELNIQSLVQFDPGAALMAGKTRNDPILEDYNNIWGLRYGPVDSDEWEAKMFATKGEMSEYISNVVLQELIVEALEQTIIVSPFDYTQKKITVLPEGSEKTVTLKAEGVNLRKEDTQYTVYIPRRFMKKEYAEKE